MHAGRSLLGPIVVFTALAVAGPVQAQGGERFAVRGVDRTDVLNVRAEPAATSRVRGTIPPDARGVLASGRRRSVGGSVWIEVRYGVTSGWVNAHFLTRERPLPPPVEATAQASDTVEVAEYPHEGSEVFDEDLVCYLNEPFWKISIRKDGQTACTETCDGPPDLHASVARPVPGRSDAWSMELRGPTSASFMAVTVRRDAGCTEELSNNRYRYAIAARRPGGKVFNGCCNPSGGSPPAPSRPGSQTAWNVRPSDR